PTLDQALEEPNGLIAVGGCLSPQRIINAYRHGIFPWFNPDEPILWWSPNPRLVLFPEKLKVSRSLNKTLRKQLFEIRLDSAFLSVIQACAEPRPEQAGTWISNQMKQAYLQLHHLGIAHSVEAWQDGELVGGLYGISLGQVFFGESMFHRKTDASKVVFVHLVKQLTNWGYRLIDCQVKSEHLVSLGAEEISRDEFANLLNHYCDQQADAQAWQP
ncbi:MAG: leucyl/phenylalanyl-tRNA--protein transferase, partial [Methylomonas lenta]|nr:leucyl/phenylalanyl-tRNA--protein transferase [Methylomonas lenta]